MNLKIKKTILANMLSSGDSHDVSVLDFITKTKYPVYVITRDVDHFHVSGAEEVAEDKKTGEVPGKVSGLPVPPPARKHRFGRVK